jgi:hypothetical protein
MECELCHKLFRDACDLRRHKARKVPCIAPANPAEGAQKCPRCNREFASNASMMRHVHRNRCEAPAPDLRAMQDRINRLEAALAQRPPSPENDDPVDFDSDEWAEGVTAEMIGAAFDENRRLREYRVLGDTERTDPSTASPYVVECFIEIVRRLSNTKRWQNIRVNKKRADQVVIYQKGRWIVYPFTCAIEMLYGRIVRRLRAITSSDSERTRLIPEVQNAISWVYILYEDDVAGHVKKSQVLMSAHLANIK